MNWHRATDSRPDRAGWYLVIEHMTTRPAVLWWSAKSQDFWRGSTKINVTWWAEIEYPNESKTQQR